MKTNYTIELKKELVKRYYDGESASTICLHTGVPRSTLYTWLKPYKTTKTAAGYEVNAADFVRQKQHIKKLESMVKILQTVDCTVSSPLKVKLKQMTELYSEYSVHILCDTLKVPRGTFYNHILRNKRGNDSYKERREMLSKRIKEIFDESNQVYGAKKIRAILQTKGINTTDKMVLELMQAMHLQSIRTGSKSRYNKIINEGKKDSLKMNFNTTAPNQVWVSDITYFRVCDKTRYICAILDLYSRRAIAYKISQNQSSQLVSSTFKLAYKSRMPKAGMIFHSDRGSQYVSNSFRKLLTTLGIKQSFSPTASPYHNAVMESFFSHLKTEELYRYNYHSINEFNQVVYNAIDKYNNKRPHSYIGNKTPNAYEQEYFSKK